MPFHAPSDFAFMFDSTTGLGTDAVYSVNAATVGIILRSTALEEEGFEVDLKTHVIGCEVMTSDIPSMVTGATLTISDSNSAFNGNVYSVVRIGADEEGVTKLEFRESG
tara:strand:+ start:8842 stop:9168 length:327 start_codon:yes stop_codon:yes gene_type:complete